MCKKENEMLGEKNIVAISTALGNGGISIIRMSGKTVLQVAKSVFTPIKKEAELEPRKLTLGTFRYGDISDKCLAVYFKAPFSYTGEDIVEFQIHGGVTLTNKIYESLVDLGCTPASKGEFSKLAFLNGKMSLDEAEGVIDLINAESESELRAGYDLVQGKLKGEVSSLQDILTETLAKIEVTLDYPEEDLEEESKEFIRSRLVKTKEQISTLLSTAKLGKAIKEGTKIAIYGKTNAGKSSLLNALLNYERAIVTDIQGTTRDVIEETFVYKGYKFILMDTAGIRDTSDIVEKIGIDRSKQSIKTADIILFIVDSSRELSSEDYEIMKDIGGKNVIAVINKCDLENKCDLSKIPFDKKVEISTTLGTGIDILKEELLSYVIGSGVNNNSLVITNARHIESLKSAKKNLDTAIQNLDSGFDLDLISIDIKASWLNLGDITGNSDNEKIIDEIFSKFCVGK